MNSLKDRPDLGNNYAIVRASVEDAKTIAEHRTRMFYDMGQLNEDEFEDLKDAITKKLIPLLKSGDYLGWLVKDNGRVVAGAGAVMNLRLPAPGNHDGLRECYIYNVYTNRSHRRRGLARKLIEEILAWARTEAIPRIRLHASNQGYTLYKSLGFIDTNEMDFPG